MADETAINKSFAKRGDGNPGIKTIDSMYYGFARIK